MKTLSKYLIVFLFGSLILSFSEGDAYKLRKEINLRADFIRCDELGNVFVVRDNHLTKYNPAGDVMHVYSNLQYGKITFIDTHDPFKILVYYKDFGQIEYLDRTLSLISTRIDLNQLYSGLPSLACASYQGAFWVYDPVSFELVRMSQGLQVNERSGNLHQATGYNLDPNYMLERDNYLYLNDPSTGIFIFDKYGTYYKLVPVQGLQSFQVFNNRIIYYVGDEISIYDVKLNELNTTNLPFPDVRSAAACLSSQPQKLFMLGSDKLFFYDIQ